MRSYIDAFYLENNDNLSVARMVRYKPRGILHLHIAMETPIIPRDWAEMSKVNGMDYFFSDIRSTVVDAHTAALNKVPGKKVEVATMVAKVREFLKEKDSDGNVLSHSLVHLQMCNTDLDHFSAMRILGLTEMGLIY